MQLIRRTAPLFLSVQPLQDYVRGSSRRIFLLPLCLTLSPHSPPPYQNGRTDGYSICDHGGALAETEEGQRPLIVISFPHSSQSSTPIKSQLSHIRARYKLTISNPSILLTRSPLLTESFGAVRVLCNLTTSWASEGKYIAKLPSFRPFVPLSNAFLELFLVGIQLQI